MKLSKAEVFGDGCLSVRSNHDSLIKNGFKTGESVYIISKLSLDRTKQKIRQLKTLASNLESIKRQLLAKLKIYESLTEKRVEK